MIINILSLQSQAQIPLLMLLFSNLTARLNSVTRLHMLNRVIPKMGTRRRDVQTISSQFICPSEKGWLAPEK